MTITSRGVTALWLAMCPAFDALPARASTQESTQVRIEVVNVPRPVSEAIRQIEERFGIVVTYEDGSYVAPVDIVEVPEVLRQDGTTSRRHRVMRADSITVAHTPTVASVDAQVWEVLGRLLAQWNRAPHSGQFRLDRVVGGYHIIPVARKGKSGSAEPYSSPLDTLVAFPSEERDGLELMSVLAQAISAGSGRQVFEGVMPRKRLSQAKLVLGADNQPARQILWNVLQAIDPALSWQVLCEVGDNSICAINLHYVGRRR